MKKNKKKLHPYHKILVDKLSFIYYMEDISMQKRNKFVENLLKINVMEEVINKGEKNDEIGN